MVQRLMRIGLYLLGAIGALYLAMLSMFFFSSNFCEVSATASFPSPSLDRAVEVERQSCRGEEAVVTAWLRLYSASDPAGNIRTELATASPPAEAVAGGPPPILAVWSSDSHVRLVVPRGARKVFERGAVEGVTVKYEER